MNKPSILADTDLCVMCGMCLPHCPTYQLYQTETESPRGRIALMQSIENGQIDESPTVIQHIDHCLGCLNCETTCPSRVPYGKLIDNFRQQFTERLPRSFTSRQILRQASKPNGLQSLASVSRTPIIRQILNVTSPLTGIPSHLLGSASTNLNEFYPATSHTRGQVLFFTGCAGRQSDPDTLLDAARFLNQLGFDVSIPDKQLCCGALHQHNGQQETAQTLLKHNHELLKSQSTQAILYFSPACGSSLKQLNDLPIMDVREFIHKQLNQQSLNFRPCKQTVALHESCSHRNMLKQKNLNQQLLNFIPDINLMQSKQANLCCGAGGLQAINYPEQGQQLLRKKLDSFDLTQTNILLSDNIGCSQHIKSAISAYNPVIEILHPVSLLARQLIIEGR